MSLAKFLRKTWEKKSQATIEYLVLFTIVTLATALSINSLLSRVQQSGDEAVDRSIEKMSGICSGEGCTTPVPPEPTPAPSD
jgi:hypothetical protein